MFKKSNRGFTLIELLVVIAIVGVLSSVVLASLNSARAKGANAAIKANLNNIRSQAEMSYDDFKSYSAPSVCNNINVGKRMIDAVSLITSVECNSPPPGNAWAAQALLKIDEGSYHYWCVDSVGNSRGVTAVQGTLSGATVCP